MSKQTHRKTKIIATLGPATDSKEKIAALIRAGVDVFRLNFSHGTREQHRRRISWIRQIARNTGKDVAILQDIQGPKIRVGEMKGGHIKIKAGEELILSSRQVLGHGNLISTSYPGLHRDLRAGMHISMNDGLLSFTVRRVNNDRIVLRNLRSGVLESHKGINFAEATLSVPSLTAKDLSDIRFGIAHHVDHIALSFVRKADSVRKVRGMLERARSKIRLISKIETTEAIHNIREIIAASDGILIARGDLGTILPQGRVPFIQKELITLAHAQGRPAITATQMLETMTYNPTPTRAETSDVVNAVLDSTDAVMLSGETAVGAYPVEAARTMAAICRVAEAEYLHDDTFTMPAGSHMAGSIPHAIITSTHLATKELHIKAIITFTHTGNSARLLSTLHLRSHAALFAFTHLAATARQMHLLWGMTPVLIPLIKDFDRATEFAVQALLKRKWARRGDTIAVLSGSPMAKPGTTNTLKIIRL